MPLYILILNFTRNRGEIQCQTHQHPAQKNGGSFDHCAALAKKALLRPLDTPNADPYYAALEKELLDAINATGFGPQGFGGATTCLGVAIEQKPTHVACLPVAVNISCHVTRRASREV